ncbi:hypothetical protein [Rhodococcus rhodochrous]|uniref:hypothetical protein n=1 Tax=Rhodococcus rhodochrous TaxID=1829 RepID=UPI001E2D9A7B|nr:hypothetical protein [Rhodococcus rhodochrous]
MQTGDVLAGTGDLRTVNRLVMSNDDNLLDPSAVVGYGPVRIPHTRRAVAYRLRTRPDLDPVEVGDAARSLADLGHPHPRLHRDHRVVSASLRAALLGLWKL